jgi:hypothetical protein
MCHGFTPRDWSSDMAEEFDEELEAEADPGQPSFLEDEAADDAELLTDGGDTDESEDDE